MKWLLLLLACAVPCMGQLTLQNAHYPTIFRSGGSSVPPEAGYSLWIAPHSPVWADLLATSNANSLEKVMRVDDLSGYGNHVYAVTNLTGGNTEGCHFDSAYTLNGLRILQFGRICSAGGANANKTGLRTSNNITLIGGITLFFVGSFLAPCSVAETDGGWFGYNNFELLARRNSTIDRVATYHNSGGVVLTDPVTIGQSNYQFYAWTYSDAGNSTALYRSNNIVASAVDNGAVPAAARVCIGFREDDLVNSHLNGGLTEMILYTNALTALQISNVNVYLKNKYGL